MGCVLTSQSLLDLEGQALADWWIVFGRSRESHWWNRYLRQDFQHCYALRFDGYNWILFHPGVAVTEIDVLAFTGENDLPEILKCSQATRVVRVTLFKTTQGLRIPWLFAPQTCVEQIKTLLGIRGFWILTPYQLYQHLKDLKHGIKS